VYDVLFPYARRHLERYLSAHAGSPELDEVAVMLAEEWSADVALGESVPARAPSANDRASLLEYLNWLMERDRKSPGLKRVQGFIWEQGYRTGELRSQVFADVPPAFSRWRDAGLTIAIYSSGSVLAQRLLFAHSDRGDLTPFVTSYFDTAVGTKRSAESYSRIASSLRLEAGAIVFVSDVDAELEAAREAGCRVVMCVRPGNAATVSSVAPTVDSFDAISI
jgi:enolase-phosphatase E1